jgi:GDP-4-dehydro-6-deoxy-D-mannose reductase
MRTLVTGATGFAGGHLTEALLARGNEVFGLSRRGAWPPEWAHLAGRVPLFACDLATDPGLEDLLRRQAPQRVCHLAGYAHVGRSLQEPEAAWAGNLNATRRLYDAIGHWGQRPRVLYVGSGIVYGDSLEGGKPQDEDSPLLPGTPYAASKAAADLVSYQVTRHPGLDVVRARPFNHIGPRQSSQYAVSHFARQLAAGSRGRQPAVLEAGDLRPQRDLTDVRDTVAAYLLLLEQGRSGEAFNVASGHSLSMQAVLDRLVSLSGRTVEVRQKADLLRPADLHTVRADASRLRALGWRPRFALDQTLADLLAYWRDAEGG